MAEHTLPQITISAKEVCRSYDSREVVRSVSFELRQGEVLGFLGPNGAGKSSPRLHPSTANCQ